MFEFCEVIDVCRQTPDNGRRALGQLREKAVACLCANTRPYGRVFFPPACAAAITIRGVPTSQFAVPFPGSRQHSTFVHATCVHCLGARGVCWCAEIQRVRTSWLLSVSLGGDSIFWTLKVSRGPRPPLGTRVGCRALLSLRACDAYSKALMEWNETNARHRQMRVCVCCTEYSSRVFS